MDCNFDPYNVFYFLNYPFLIFYFGDTCDCSRRKMGDCMCIKTSLQTGWGGWYVDFLTLYAVPSFCRCSSCCCCRAVHLRCRNSCAFSTFAIVAGEGWTCTIAVRIHDECDVVVNVAVRFPLSCMAEAGCFKGGSSRCCCGEGEVRRRFLNAAAEISSPTDCIAGRFGGRSAAATRRGEGGGGEVQDAGRRPPCARR